MPKPSEDPTFATTGTRTAPASSRRLSGYLAGEPLPAAIFNYLIGAAGDWIVWLEGQIDELRGVADVTVDLGSVFSAGWELDSVIRAQFPTPFPDRFGFMPDSGTAIAYARKHLWLPRVDGAAAARLKAVRANVRRQTVDDTLLFALYEQPHVGGSSTVIASQAVTTTGLDLEAFLWEPDELLSPVASYYVEITMQRDDGANHIEVYDVRCTVERSRGEG